MTALAWTSEPPTEPGWYWHRFEDLGEEVVLVERVSTGELWQLSVYGMRKPLAEKAGEWAGPLVAPEVTP